MSEEKKEKARLTKKKITNIVTLTLTLLLAVLVVLLLVSKLRNEPLFIGGRSIMWVLTGSMEDEIPAQSYILIKKTTAAEVEVGDVIVFYSDIPALQNKQTTLVTHRVREIIGDHEAFITRGDNNPLNDETPAQGDKVIAVYTGRLPILSFFGRILASPFGLMLIFIVVLGVGAALYLPDANRAMREMVAEAKNKKQAEFDRLVQEEVERLKAQKAAEAHESEAPSPSDGSDKTTTE